MTIHTAFPQTSLPFVPATDGHYDIYGIIHKALRRAHCDMLTRLGQADFDRPEVLTLIADLRGLLTISAGHLDHEDVHIHAALDRRRPGASQATEADHDHHREAFVRLGTILNRFDHALASDRLAIGRELYLTYSLFVAQDFRHMFDEETALSAQLWEAFSDHELAEIEGGLKASLPPQEMMVLMAMMIPAISRDQRVVMLNDIRIHAPQPVFDAVIQHAARPTLTAEDMADLERRLVLLSTFPA